MSENQNQKTKEELQDELERAKLERELNEVKYGNAKENSQRYKSAKRLRLFSILDLCIIPAVLSLGILPLITWIFLLMHDAKEENTGLKIAAVILYLFFIIPGAVCTLIFANKEMKN